jgi:hypothetical protein
MPFSGRDPIFWQKGHQFLINFISVNLDKPEKNRHENTKKKDRGLKMEPIQLTDGVYDVGVIDWNIRDFHGYSTDIGTTYNSFLIVDEKTVLIDTVRKEFSDQLIDNIAAVIDPKKIDYVISNHTELDHSGGLARVMHKIGEDKPVYASKMGHKNLPKHFRQNLNYRAVANGEVLSLGQRTLMYLASTMPDPKNLMMRSAIGLWFMRKNILPIFCCCTPPISKNCWITSWGSGWSSI